MAVLERKNVKKIVIGAVAVLAVAGVIVGAKLGQTKNASPADAIIDAQVDTQSRSSESAAAGDGPLFEIKTPTRYDCTLAPYLVADKLGYFKEEGIKLVFTGELTNAEVTPSILSGSNDVADTHPNSLALKVFGGAQIKAVGRSIIEPEESADPRLRHMWYFVTQEAYDAGVKTIADLASYKGSEKLKSAGYADTCETFILNKDLDAAGVPREKLEWITFETDISKIQALSLKQVDVIGVHPPFYDAAAEAGLVKIGDSSEAGLGEATGVYLYYFSDDFIAKHPDEVGGFVRAMTKAQKWANANLEQTARWTGEFIKQEVKGNHFYSETTVIDESTVQPWLDDLISTGTLAKGDIEIADFITHQFEAE